MIHILNNQPSLANSFLAALRDKTVQSDRATFRRNVATLGRLMAFEISKKLNYDNRVVETPLGKTTIAMISEQPLLITVLRAGIPFFNGFEDSYPQADCGFIGAYRKEGSGDITIKLDYVATPILEGRVVILIDPMLATGKSIIKAVEAMGTNGTPSYIHVASLVAAPEGVKYVEENLEIPHTLWAWALDEKLNDKYYIVPGLGDAGDLSYGEKL